MDSHSEHSGAPEPADGDVVSSGPRSPAEPAVPEPEPEREQEAVETSEGGAAAGEPPELPEPAQSPEAAELAEREGSAATEAEGEEGPGEQEWPAEAEPEEQTEAGPEEPGKPGPAGGPEEPEEREAAPEEEEEEDEEEEQRRRRQQQQQQDEEETPEEARRHKASLRFSLGLSGTGQEEAAQQREEPEGGAESEESERKSVEGSRAPSEGLQDENLEWTEDVQKLQEQQLRSELLEQYQTLMEERSHYKRYNAYLQYKIIEALRKKKGLDVAPAARDKDAEPDASKKEEAYFRYLAVLEELRKQRADDLEWYHLELDQLKQQCKEKLSRAEKEWRSFQALKKHVVMQAMGSCRMRGGRQAALREVEQIQALEEKKEQEMSAVRLENVQLKQSLAHFETRMRAQDDMTEGLLLIDFEQLKIENQTFNEKVEERNEELLKLRHKVSNNVQIIAHVKEKLHFVDFENACRKSQLLEVEAQVALKRDILTKAKQARDGLRIDNAKLNQKCGLLGKESLLRDMEQVVGKAELLRERLEALKRHHAGLLLSCSGVKQKIREAKAFLPRS